MDDQGCPRCKTTKYRNPSLKLMVNVCGHTLCENCVDMLFVRGSGNCVQCDTPLRKSNFRLQLFEDPAIDKEVEIRKRVLKIYNKRDFDFSSLREYNDYLEQVEEIVYNLTNNVDVERTKQIMEQYQRENRDVIQRNKVKLVSVLWEECVMSWTSSAVSIERSQLPASILLAQHKDRAAQLETQIEKQKQSVKPTTIFSTGIPKGQTVSLAPVIRVEEVLYKYQPIHVETYGPPLPELEQLDRLGYLNHVRTATPQDLAGGYTSELACHRALQDAFSGLFTSLV
uniref:CDK-activating kinase assembly factor MAT1 n=1 Tax=Astyanax mexicanus TaxID=7994 RepID=A0A3B1K9Y1_ASTMX